MLSTNDVHTISIYGSLIGLFWNDTNVVGLINPDAEVQSIKPSEERLRTCATLILAMTRVNRARCFVIKHEVESWGMFQTLNWEITGHTSHPINTAPGGYRIPPAPKAVYVMINTSKLPVLLAGRLVVDCEIKAVAASNTQYGVCSVDVASVVWIALRVHTTRAAAIQSHQTCSADSSGSSFGLELSKQHCNAEFRSH